MTRERRKRILIILLVLFSAALVQGRCLFLGFNSFWDLIHVFQNPFQSPLSFRLLRDAFTVIVEAEYAPLRLWTNSFDFTFWNFNPFGHHLSSYLIFLVDVLLVFFLVEKLLIRAGRRSPERLALAGLTAFLFGIHPFRVEVVSWITPREYLICLGFYLLGIILYLRWTFTRSLRWYLSTVLCAIGAGLCQPFSVSFPAALLLLDWYPLNRFRSGSRKRVLAEKIPFLIVALLVAAKIYQIRHQVGLIHPTGFSALLRNLAEFPAVVFYYVYKTVFPLVLAPIYPLDRTSDPRLMAFSGVLVVGSLALLAARRKKYPGFLAGALFIILALLPSGGVMRSGLTVLADRYVQLASVPILLGISFLFIKGLGSARFRRGVILIGSLWVIFLVWKTLAYTSLWDQPVELTRQAHARWPRSRIIEILMLRTYSETAVRLIEKGRPEEALELMKKSLEINPGYVDGYLVRAHALARQGKDKEALKVYQKAQEIGRNYGNTYLNRGILYGRRGELTRAEDEFLKALVYGGESAEVHYNLGLIYEIRGELVRSENEFRRALALNVFSPEIYGRLAKVLEAQEKFPEVAEVYRQAVKNNPRDPGYRLALGFAALRAGEAKEAEAAFREALGREEDLGAAYHGLAACASFRGDKEEASRFREEARRRGYEGQPGERPRIR